MFQQIWNIYFEWGKSKGYRKNDMYNVPTFLMLIDVAHINKECNYLVNQYLDEVGGINTLVEKEMARLKEKYITQYLGTLQEVHYYYNEPKGWYQGEPYWDEFPGPDVSSWN